MIGLVWTVVKVGIVFSFMLASVEVAGYGVEFWWDRKGRAWYRTMRYRRWL